MSGFSQGTVGALTALLYGQHLIQILLEFFSLDQPFCTNIKHERTVWLPQELVDFIDADVAVFSGFSNGQGHFQMNRYFFTGMSHSDTSYG